SIPVPSVRAATEFELRWQDDTGVALGRTRLVAQPNLLAELAVCAGIKALGLYDPQNLIKPLLTNANVNITDLTEVAVEKFSGRLLIVIATSRASAVELQPRVKKRVADGVNAVFISPSL